jgi:tRNA pseudouridine65 synthase
MIMVCARCRSPVDASDQLIPERVLTGGRPSRHPSVLEILHQDEAIVVVAKPAGLLVHRTDEAPDRTVVLQQARDATGGGHLFPVHRLDRGASGVLVLARSREAARALHDQFEEGRADKRYLVAVRGAPLEAGTIDHPIPRRPGGPRVAALTEYRRLATVTLELPVREPRYSLVEARTRSGRLHQVRRHLKHIAHPVLGDAGYGRSEHNRLCRERFGLFRLALHASALAFDHPGSGARVHFEAPFPPDLREPLRRMGFDVSSVEADLRGREP